MEGVYHHANKQRNNTPVAPRSAKENKATGHFIPIQQTSTEREKHLLLTKQGLTLIPPHALAALHRGVVAAFTGRNGRDGRWRAQTRGTQTTIGQP